MSLIIAVQACLWVGRAIFAEYFLIADDYVWDR